MVSYIILLIFASFMDKFLFQFLIFILCHRLYNGFNIQNSPFCLPHGINNILKRNIIYIGTVINWHGYCEIYIYQIICLFYLLIQILLKKYEYETDRTGLMPIYNPYSSYLFWTTSHKYYAYPTASIIYNLACYFFMN